MPVAILILVVVSAVVVSVTIYLKASKSPNVDKLISGFKDDNAVDLAIERDKVSDKIDKHVERKLNKIDIDMSELDELTK